MIPRGFCNFSMTNYYYYNYYRQKPKKKWGKCSCIKGEILQNLKQQHCLFVFFFFYCHFSLCVPKKIKTFRGDITFIVTCTIILSNIFSDIFERNSYCCCNTNIQTNLSNRNSSYGSLTVQLLKKKNNNKNEISSVKL